MKIKNFLAMIVAASAMVMSVASCDDDDNPVVDTTTAATAMAGTYKGEYVLTVMGSGDTTRAEIEIKKIDDNTIQLVTPSAGSGAMALPSFSLDIKASGRDNVYTATADNITGSITVNDTEKSYTFSDVAVVVSGNTAAVNYSLQYGRMPMAMVISFKGDKE